jgi:hypothetical protein
MWQEDKRTEKGIFRRKTKVVQGDQIGPIFASSASLYLVVWLKK